MRILFIGDVMGRTGRDAMTNHLPRLKKELQADVVIINGENAAHGIGITGKICESLYESGADCITTGNHIWDQREIIPYIDKDPKLLRPLNFPEGTVGNGFYIHEVSGGGRIMIVNAMARLFMDPMDDPFRALHDLVGKYPLKRSVQAIFVDFHGEATSEKMAMGHYLDGRISGLVGTHTHVPTADHHIMAQGTAYQTDAGMTGDYDSVIGVRKDIPIHRFTKKTPSERMVPSDGEATICGTFIETSDATGLAKNIAPVRVGGKLHPVMPNF